MEVNDTVARIAHQELTSDSATPETIAVGKGR
jgi:hypothetical protein